MEAEKCTFFGPLPLLSGLSVADRRRQSDERSKVMNCALLPVLFHEYGDPLFTVYWLEGLTTISTMHLKDRACVLSA